MLMFMIAGFWLYGDQMSEQLQAKMGDNATKFALGIVIGMFAFGIVGMFSHGLQGMARTGHLEQLCMSPHGLVTNFMARTFVSSIQAILSCAFLVWLVSRTVDGQLYFDAVPVLFLLVMTYLNLIGFGFMVGGLVLVFKQTGQVAVLIRMGLLALAVFASPDMMTWHWSAQAFLHALPIADAAICLKLVLIEGAGWSIFGHSSLYFMIVNAAAWTFLGLLCFRYFENWSRDKGTLGAY
jgi:hypothetical protein